MVTTVDDRPDSRAEASFGGRADGPSALGRATQVAAAGAAATAAMSVVMAAIRRVRLIDKLAPRLIVDSTAARLAPSGLQFAKPITAIAHLASGSAAVPLFGLVSPALRGPRPPKGLAFAAAVLLASYEGWVPAAGIPLHRQRVDRAAELVVGHAVYGIVSGRLAG